MGMRLAGGERDLEHPVLVSLLGICIGLLVWLVPFALELEDENTDQQRLIAGLVGLEDEQADVIDGILCELEGEECGDGKG